MGKIKILDNLTIQKIAAGEVIERPSSIVKELVENSIDANAKTIVIEIKNGGKSLIRVTDDGDGIEEEDLPLAFKRHSTSKLSKIDDLFTIMTLGFRGEALSSIASVAKVDVLTKTDSSRAGVHAKLEEGEIISINSIGTPKGTTIIVKDLFYNLPVRKKFLKSDTSEGNSINDIISKLAIGNPNVSIKFIRDDKVIINTIGNVDLKENIYTILGKDIYKGLTPIEYRDENIELKGYISNNNLYRSNRSHQYLYINGRYILNFGISATIEGQYKSTIPINRYPVFILYLTINPEDLDVNIHPTKQEVKFINDYDINGVIGNIIKKQLFGIMSVPSFEIPVENKKVINELKDLTYNEVNERNKDLIIRDISFDDDIDYIPEFIDNSTDNSDYDNLNDYLDDELCNINLLDIDLKEQITIDNLQKEKYKIEGVLNNISPIGILFNTYIIAENREKNIIVFIDQHAAHERIMYEKYKNEYINEKISIQQLLVPEIVELTNTEISDFKKNIKLFKVLGFEVEEFGHNTVAIRGVPFIFGVPSIKSLFMDLIDSLDKDIESNYDLHVEKIMKIACTSAIKSGDKMSRLEIESLLNDLIKCDNPYTCPHGRPTTIEMTKRDLEKQFLRII